MRKANHVYTHRVNYTFTSKAGPERSGVSFYQNFTSEQWAKDYYDFCLKSDMFKDVSMEKLGDQGE